MKLVDSVKIDELKDMAAKMHGDLVKAVVDIEMNLLVIGAELHADEEAMLLEQGSEQNNLWGINLHPAKYGTGGFVEFDSMINIRPSQNNMNRGVDDVEIRQKIREIVDKKVSK